VLGLGIPAALTRQEDNVGISINVIDKIIAIAIIFMFIFPFSFFISTTISSHLPLFNHYGKLFQCLSLMHSRTGSHVKKRTATILHRQRYKGLFASLAIIER
jgi:hypothetical protein